MDRIEAWSALALIFVLLAAWTFPGTPALLPFAAISVVLAERHRSLAPTIGLVGAGLLAEHYGGLGLEPLGFPVNLAKVASAVLVVQVLRWRTVDPSLALPLGAVVVASFGSAVVHGGGWGAEGVLSVATLAMMTLAVATASHDELASGLRSLALASVPLLALSMWEARAAPGAAALDAAWHVRAKGTTVHPNAWALLLVLWLPMGSGALLEPSAAGESTSRWKIPYDAAWILLVAGCAVNLAQTMSRAAIVVGLASLLAVVVIGWSWRRSLLALALVGALMLLLVRLDWLGLRMQTLWRSSLEAELGHGSIAQRGELRRVGLQLLREHWLLGMGIGTFPARSAEHLPYARQLSAHNAYLTVATEWGVVGVGAWLWMGVVVSARTVRAALPRSPLGRGILVSLATAATLALTVDIQTSSMVWWVFGLGCGAAAALGRVPDSPPGAGAAP